MPVPHTYQQAGNPSTINETTQETPRKHRRAETIRPMPQYHPQLPIIYMPPSHHQVPFPHTIASAPVEMPPTNHSAGLDQRRTSSTHSTRTTTGAGPAPTHRPSTNGGHQFPAGFGFAPDTAKTGPPSYASDPNVSPTFPLYNTGQNMPPPRPELEHMIVSVNRQKLSSDDMQWTTQFPLEGLRTSKDSPISINKLLFSRLLDEIYDNLRNQVQEEGLSVVWVMSSIDQLGVIRDDSSLRASVLDHQNAGQHTVQLYVVREKAEGTVLPESQFISSKTFILPKVPSMANVLSPDMPQQDNTPRQPNFANGFGFRA